MPDDQAEVNMRLLAIHDADLAREVAALRKVVIGMSDSGSAAVRRAARLVVAIAIGNVVAFLAVEIMRPHAVVPMFAGWCMAWLTAVAWVGFQEVRRAR